MKSHAKILTLLFALTLALSACTPQTATAPSIDTPQPSPTATPLPPTATPLPPVLMVGGDVPCYAGPGADYEIMTTISIGMKMEVLSRDGTGEYWIVKSLAGDGQCWTESRYATIVGQAENIPILAADAIPTTALRPPQAPKKFDVSATCIVTSRGNNNPFHPSKEVEKAISIILTWSAVDSEQGYRIYKDGVLLVELEKGILEYKEVIPDERGRLPVQTVYSLEAYNSDGSSPRLDATIAIANACKI